jgi:hypothetical protein
MIGLLVLASVVLSIPFLVWGTVAYVAAHFISKFW